MPLSVLFLSLALLFSSASQPVRHFKKIPTSQFPRAVVERDFCLEKEPGEPGCWQEFLKWGAVWTGDVNDDGANELLVFPGSGWQGSGGLTYFVYQKRKSWVSLTRNPDSHDDDDSGWFTLDPRFDILPVVRDGYHDLRVAADVCMKWDGKQYVEYDPADYHRLNPGWFNERDSRDAEIFWAIRYAGQEKVIIAPQWFPITQDDFVLPGQSPRSGRVFTPRRVGAVELEDPEQHLRWYAMHKGGVWAVRGNQAFFLAPQVSETFEDVGHLKIEGDWLLGYGFAKEDFETLVGPIDKLETPRPSIRYNRRTHELILDRHDYVDSPD